MYHRSKIKHKPTKLLECNTGKLSNDLGFADNFSDTMPKHKRIDQVDFVKIKYILYGRHCQENEKTSHRVEKIFVQDTSDKRLIKNIQRPLKAQQ